MHEESKTPEAEVAAVAPSSVEGGESAPAYSYADYVALGGRIDEANFTRVMERALVETKANLGEGFSKNQTGLTAEISGVNLDAVTAEAGIDPRCIYGILRYDEKPKDVEYHHGAMSDQVLLVESLRMVGAVEAVNAIVEKHPHIPFN